MILGLATIVYQLFDGSAKRRTIEDYAHAIRERDQQAVAQKRMLDHLSSQLTERDRVGGELRRRVSTLECENATLELKSVGASVRSKAK